MKEYRVTNTIQATPDAIWAILTDASGYTDWDPNIINLEGTIALGERIKVYTKLSPDRTFPVKVTEFIPGEKMVWASGMPLGLFKGERTFTLTAQDGGGTKFSMREVFSGLLLPLIGRSIPDMTEPFQQFAAGLKSRAESAA